MRRVLVANRGEIARRIFRTAHRLGLDTVAVYSEADRGALHVQEATEAHPLGGAAVDSYLRIDSLVEAARACGADAVHPGYGFLSENEEFARAVADVGLLWIGPSPEALRALGSKARAKELAHARGIPCLPGYQGPDQSDERLLAAARDLGYPLMVKASAGGGGRGMRLVTDAAQLPAALQLARSEAQAAFGDGELLLERALPHPRHVEVQVIADMHGRCLYLGERDCSVQRRHQKLIEESPSPSVDPALRERLGQQAVELARAAGYVGVGTVEFLLDEHGRSWLLEMNARLQVEHAVTEMVSGLDLVEWQLRIAGGERLPYRQEHLNLQGHAVEARLCAEDAAFLPQAGRIQAFHAPPAGESRNGGTRLRFEHALFEGLAVTPHYDSLLGKLIAHGPTREQAIARLLSALDALCVLGLPTNRRLLAACLRHPVFAAGEARIDFLEQHGDAMRRALAAEEFGAAPTAALALLLPQGPAAALPSPFTRPWRVRHHGDLLDLPVCEADGVVPPPVHVALVRPGCWHLQHGAVDLFLEDASCDPPAGAALARAADELRVPFNGKVVAVHARPGVAVRKGDTLVVVESMKLEHALGAARDGTVRSLHVHPGQQVAASQVLVTFESAA
ncbi:acetyl/propionyl/methylcrotonyl-CoA carboxylase subunit alpha [Ramlibacter monticola]|uniref:acetyl/propionyl/methylcrotonyl-CoA carboxylase subunit alpha n=1 Tax=Ramlibacter monticola TaxID=1926872 RepID=UPI002ED6AC8A